MPDMRLTTGGGALDNDELAVRPSGGALDDELVVMLAAASRCSSTSSFVALRLRSTTGRTTSLESKPSRKAGDGGESAEDCASPSAMSQDAPLCFLCAFSSAALR